MVAANGGQTRISLHGEEALRMTLLSEEVIAAAYEQALIVGGVLELDDFKPVSLKVDVGTAGEQVLRFIDAAGRCICYDWSSQLCYQS